MASILIGDKALGRGNRPFIVAEMSGNHNNSLERALELVDAAADAGVDGLKLQTYTADSITLNVSSGEFLISDQSNPWHGRTLHDLYSEASMPWEWQPKVFQRCKERGLIGFSSPFDSSAVDFLEELDVPCYKIASCENRDLPLIEKAAKTGKPVIISTAMASLEEVKEAVETVRACQNENVILLKCTCSYPAPAGEANLNTLVDMREKLGVLVGLSDHSMENHVAIASVALGACLIEKHFTLSRKDGGPDSFFSLEPDELKTLVTTVHETWESLGVAFYGCTDADKGSAKYRRSLYIAEDIPAGGVLNEQNLRSIRPALGLEPKYYKKVMGARLKAAVSKGTPLSWDLIEINKPE